MAKIKKKPAPKSKPAAKAKAIKPAPKVKAAKPAKVAKVAKAVKPAKAVKAPKASKPEKVAKVAKTTAPAKADKLTKKLEAAAKGKGAPVPEKEKKISKAEQKRLDKEAAKAAKKKQEEEDVEDILEEDFGPMGDAIRLTPQDLEDPEELFLTDAEGRRYCKVKDCDQLAAVEGFCRYHYLSLWKKIQTRKKILSEGKLEKYIEELTSRYPDKYIEMIRRDLKTEKDFISAIQELEIDESLEGDFEEDSGFADEIRGISRGRGGEESGGSEEF